MSDVNTKLTALANEVRDLSGTAAPKSIDAMISDIAMANAEVATQADLISDQNAKIAELAEILNSKASVTPILQNKTVMPTAETQTITADVGYDGLSSVVIEPLDDSYFQYDFHHANIIHHIRLPNSFEVYKYPTLQGILIFYHFL